MSKRWRQQFMFARKSVQLTFVPTCISPLGKSPIFPQKYYCHQHHPGHLGWPDLPVISADTMPLVLPKPYAIRHWVTTLVPSPREKAPSGLSALWELLCQVLVSGKTLLTTLVPSPGTKFQVVHRLSGSLFLVWLSLYAGTVFTRLYFVGSDGQWKKTLAYYDKVLFTAVDSFIGHA